MPLAAWIEISYIINKKPMTAGWRIVMKIGITGGIGSGKSTVTDYLTEKGYDVIDCDKLARDIVEPGSPVLEKLAESLGTDILMADGSLDRDKTARIVFNDEKKREILNSITHTEIYDIIDERVASDPEKVHFIDAALMFETGSDKMMDVVWLVTCRDDIRKKRIALRDNMDEDMIDARIKSQMAEELKKEKADEILDNSGTREELYAGVEKLLEKYI
jgi:dephospho-CoA kinase